MMSKPDLSALKESGALTVAVMAEVAARAKPGVTTAELDAWAESYIKDHGGTPAFLGHRGYPSTLCTSVNEEVVHGLPGDRKLSDGDILSIDVGVKIRGWYTDSATTFGIGEIGQEKTKLLEVTSQALTLALGQARDGCRTGDLGAAVQTYVAGQGMDVVRDCVGHGIGQSLHEDPSIPNFGKPGTGAKFKDQMVVAIEPMVTLGSPKLEHAPDKWTLRTRDKSLSAHFEETVVITKAEPIRLTPLPVSLHGEKSGDRLGKVA